jgi:AAA15 family ATPase/GTPase
MLDSISIKNFKRIQGDTPLVLNDLAKVNYLVGPNGGGKSSVLELITYFQNKGNINSNDTIYNDPDYLKINDVNFYNALGDLRSIFNENSVFTFKILTTSETRNIAFSEVRNIAYKYHGLKYNESEWIFTSDLVIKGKTHLE